MQPSSRRSWFFGVLAASVTVVACSGSPNSPTPPQASVSASPALKAATSAPRHHKVHPLGSVGSGIKYVIVVIQENRTLNNLFNGFPGASTTTSGPNGPLTPSPLATSCDPYHTYTEFLRDANWDGSKFLNNGWINAGSTCGNGAGLSYVSQIPYVYNDLATNYVLAARTFQMNQGPSFPAHQYLIAGQSGGFYGTGNTYAANDATVGNPGAGSPGGTPGKAQIGTTGGCDTTGVIAYPMNMPGQTFPGNFDTTNTNIPCQDYKTIFDVIINNTQLNPQPTWRYYTPFHRTIWSAPVGVTHLYNGGAGACATQYSTNCYDASQSEALHFYNAVKNASPASPFPNLSYVVPCPDWSDHPFVSNASPPDGPNWVGFIARTIGANTDIWQHAVIIVTWDDWGGWYDNILPGQGQGPFIPNTTIASPDPYNSLNRDPYEYGYRVPMLVISPYLTTTKVIDNTYRSQAAILDFIETTFGVSEGALGTLDNAAGRDDLIASHVIDPSRDPTLITPPTPTVTGFPTPPGGTLPICSDLHDVPPEPND